MPKKRKLRNPRPLGRPRSGLLTVGLLALAAACSDGAGDSSGSDGSGASGSGASGSGAGSGAGAGATTGSGAGGTGTGSGPQCQWDVPSDLGGHLYRLGGGDMGVWDDDTDSFYVIPCEGGAPQQVELELPGRPVRQVGDDRLLVRSSVGVPYSFLGPEPVLEPLASCPTGCNVTPSTKRTIDDEEHSYARDFDDCLVELTATGETVASSCTGDDEPLAPLADGVVTRRGFGEIWCWPSGVSGSAALVGTPSEIVGRPVDGVWRPSLFSLSPRGESFAAALAYSDGTGDLYLSLRLMTCAGEQDWGLDVHWDQPSSNTFTFDPQDNDALWTDGGDLVLAFRGPGGIWELDGLAGPNFVGVFDGDTGATRWLTTTSGDAFDGTAPYASPGPNGTVWVATGQTGVSVFDEDGNLLLGQGLPN